MKDKLKKMLTTNMALKIISLFLAFLLWLVVSNTQNAVQTKSVKVDIQYINEEALRNAGYVVISRQSSIVITVEVRKNDYYKVTADNFIATADLSKHMGEDLSSQLVKVQVEPRGEAENVIKNWDYPKDGPWITVRMDELQSKEMNIDLVQTGALNNSYILNKDGLTVEPQTAIVSGPKSEFGSLTAVKAQIDLSQLSPEKGQIALPIKLYDANNNVIDSQNLVVEPTEVVVNAGVTQLKEVGILFEGVTGEPKEGYKYSEITCDTKTVALSGLKAALANVTNITIPKTVLDISQAAQTVQKQVDITPYLPEGVEVYNNNMITVEIIIEKLETKTYDIPESQINWTGKSDQYLYELNDGVVSVQLRAFQEDLDGLDIGQIRLNTDVSGLSVGTHDAVFRVEIGTGFEVVEQPKAQLQITKKSSSSNASDNTTSSEKEELSSSGVSSSGIEESSTANTSTNPSESLPQQSNSENKPSSKK